MTLGSKKSANFRCFLLAVTWFFDFFQIGLRTAKLRTGGHIRAKFRANRSRNGRETLAGEKKRKKSKATENYNITPDFEKLHFYKNGNIIIMFECQHDAIVN